MGNVVRALGLWSGGLDGRLAAELLRAQSLEVIYLHVDTGFGRAAYREAVRCFGGARVLDVAGRFLREVVREPRFGYGAGMNPCLDCRIFMLREAARIAREERCGIVFTGEVLGQRPLDQSRAALTRTEEEAGLAGELLRPLSARLLPETGAERRGVVERARLERIHGRSRRAQHDLARGIGLDRFPTPSGGCCRLADRGFARRLRDLLSHGADHDPSRGEIDELKRGRHFRLAWNLKVMVGRDEAESSWLAARAGERWTCQVAGGGGAFGVLVGEPEGEGLRSVAALLARYSRAGKAGETEVVLRRGELARSVLVRAASDADVGRWRV